MDNEPARTGKNWHDLAAILLARGCSKVETARRCGVGTRTLFTHLKNPTFRQQIADLHNQFRDEMVGQLHAISSKAIKTLERLLDSQDERVLLGAVKAWKDCLFDFTNQYDLARRIEEVQHGGTDWRAEISKILGEQEQA